MSAVSDNFPSNTVVAFFEIESGDYSIIFSKPNESYSQSRK